MKKPQRPPQQYVRIDGLTAWQLLGVLSGSTPKAKVMTYQSVIYGVLTLIEHPGGPWVVVKGIPELLPTVKTK
jgi:hypothetical protein